MKLSCIDLQKIYFLPHKYKKQCGNAKKERKTRSIFDVALKVHREVQQRDIEVGRNLGNWILRWLDKMKPSANIRVTKPKPHDDVVNSTKQQLTDTSHQKPARRYGISYKDKESGGLVIHPVYARDEINTEVARGSHIRMVTYMIGLPTSS
uniref:Peptidase S8/S53 domain-containing protein n=1 Tax=Tanacetum cinerariifolium TaxID=118510 RepID=A0A699JWC8_TANCI|nr:peptidase S8/S53 domain-containing protein [Tanacetum cinerariifolium]